MMDLVYILETKLKIKDIQLNCLADQIERFKCMIDDNEKIIEWILIKENLIMNELAKEGYTVNFSKDENGEIKCNLNKEDM